VKYWTAKLNTSHKYTKYCHDGKVSLAPLTDRPELLKKLLTEITPEARNYQDHIREYNSALAFALMGAEIKPPPGHRPYCFRIHSQIYHMISPLYAKVTNKPGYGQLYIFDSAEAAKKRLENELNTGCSEIVMLQLDEMFRRMNPFAESYKQMHEIAETNPTMEVKMVFMDDPELDL
jgi:hypothetical protein